MKSSVLRSIWVTFQKVGYHCYPNAPTEPFDVSYLAARHRHLFHFSVEIAVEHNERDIEFHQFKHWLESLYSGGSLEASNRSCESLAEDLLHVVSFKYPGRWLRVTVSEDGECGSTLTLN